MRVDHESPAPPVSCDIHDYDNVYWRAHCRDNAGDERLLRPAVTHDSEDDPSDAPAV